jgi:hypothetical protein
MGGRTTTDDDDACQRDRSCSSEMARKPPSMRVAKVYPRTR